VNRGFRFGRVLIRDISIHRLVNHHDSCRIFVPYNTLYSWMTPFLTVAMYSGQSLAMGTVDQGSRNKVPISHDVEPRFTVVHLPKVWSKIYGSMYIDNDNISAKN
jgi:hypothetical protein